MQLVSHRLESIISQSLQPLDGDYLGYDTARITWQPIYGASVGTDRVIPYAAVQGTTNFHVRDSKK